MTQKSNDLTEYIYKACSYLCKYFNGQRPEEIRERQRVDALIDMFKNGYQDLEPFSKTFPQHIADSGQEPDSQLVRKILQMLSFKVICGINRQEEFKQRMEKEILKS